MSLSLAPAHLKRYGEIAWLLVKYGRGPLVADLQRDLPSGQDAGPTAPGTGTPEELADDLERLGPTFIKLGQLLSSRADLLPPAYMEALARLQDQVEPFSAMQAREIVESELGVRMGRAFDEFDPVPIAAASLGQVHRAVLRGGRPVAVKVQRPGIREQIVEDLEALRELASFLDRHSALGDRYELGKTVETFGAALLAELDYRREAQNLMLLRRNLESFERIHVPRPIDDYSSERVLTMEYVEGRKVTDLDPMTRLELDGGTLATELFEAYLHQVVIDGFFHADPHPGNVLVTEDGDLALLDLGMTGRIPSRMRDTLLRMLIAVGEGQGDEVADRALEMGERRENFDEPEFRRRVSAVVGDFAQTRLEDLRVGLVLIAVSRVAGETGIRIPPELSMLGKTLWNLDGIGKALDPSFDPTGAIRREAPNLLRRRMKQKLSPGHLASALLDARELAQELPGRLNRLLDLLSKNELRLRVDAIDETALIGGLQKIANRIAMGTVLAALIVGAAIVMQIPTRLTILGYPAIAVLLFAGAAIGGIALVASIATTDRKSRRSQRPAAGKPL
ncbi:MAG TPA: AarF/ABC1/UbiB kinase family protein [Thermoanaerobaculia bacterium]|nr:AarF/ABC1/UbiB kinase family protein [Thermoanaerobaculia bacterium]